VLPYEEEELEDFKPVVKFVFVFREATASPRTFLAACVAIAKLSSPPG